MPGFSLKIIEIIAASYEALEQYLYALSPKLQPRQNRHIQWWDSHIEAKQQLFDKCAEALLDSFSGGEGCGVDIDGKEDGDDSSSRASIISKAIRRNLDDFKLLEAFKYLLNSDQLFCKVLYVIIFIFFNLHIQPKGCMFFLLTHFFRSNFVTSSGFAKLAKSSSANVNSLLR
jgi:hypothetical protein